MNNSRRPERGRNEKKFERRNSGRSSMHSAICSECGNSCEVPFKPTSSRPVFCIRCFKKDGSSSPRRSEEKSYKGSEKTMYRATCAECGNSCEVPFKPTGGKPVFCSNCFKKDGSSNFDNFFKSDKSSNVEKKSPDQFKEHLEKLNYKLDKILKILDSAPKEIYQEPILHHPAKRQEPSRVKKEVKKVAKKGTKKRK